MTDRPAYAAAGVDVAAGERAVELMRSSVERTHAAAQVLTGLGGFASAVAMPAGMREPVLVSATDGVGTKTAIAAAMRRFDTLGHDLVAMCADDVVCAGARPLFFLDYIAVGRLEPLDVAELVAGVAAGCELAGCALVGGETAEHPGTMGAGDLDLAGFCVGVAERNELLDGTAALPGDVLVGMAASGLHANGFSLVRETLARHDLSLERPYLEVVQGRLGEAAAARVAAAEPAHLLATLGEVLLTPTRIYAPDVLALRTTLDAAGSPLRGLAHVTGGGLPGNVPRALPAGLGARLEVGSWTTASIFGLLAELAGMASREMRATFNGGLGMIAVVPRSGAEIAVDTLAERGLPAWVVGDVVSVEALEGQRYSEVGGDA
ncbi:MAG: phosphoribosylformylglycinamidine cyclo-ligase [Candidatus Limnocylindrales bacterium]